METSLYSYSIMRLNVPDDKILSVCEDIKQQYLQGISSCPLFSMHDEACDGDSDVWSIHSDDYGR